MESKIKSRRIELSLTLEEVGEMCGVGKSTVRKWENGVINDIGRSKIVLLAKALQVSPLFILQDGEEKTLTQDEMLLLDIYGKLNNINKIKTKEYIKDLTMSQDNDYSNTELLAAHAKEDATQEGINHDLELIRKIGERLGK